MTNLEIILIIIIWLFGGIFLGWKWENTKHYGIDAEICYIISIFFFPFVLLFAMIRQTFFEDWR